jgi:hypothetical protein
VRPQVAIEYYNYQVPEVIKTMTKKKRPSSIHKFFA